MSAALQRDPRGWSDRELARAKALRAEGYTFRTVADRLAAELGVLRTPDAVAKLFRELRDSGTWVETVTDQDRQAARDRRAELEAARMTRRRCLCCGSDFPSWGAGNRRCDRCKSSAEWR